MTKALSVAVHDIRNDSIELVIGVNVDNMILLRYVLLHEDDGRVLLLLSCSLSQFSLGVLHAACLLVRLPMINPQQLLQSI